MIFNLLYTSGVTGSAELFSVLQGGQFLIVVLLAAVLNLNENGN